MVLFDVTFTYGGVEFFGRSITARRELRTKKQVIGKTLIQNRVLGFSTLQIRLSINGTITAATLDADRTTLEDLNDGEAHVYVDGNHDDDYIVLPGGLIFSDSETTFGQYNFTLELVEE